MEFLFISNIIGLIPWLVPVVVVSTVVAVKTRKSVFEKTARKSNSVYALEIEKEAKNEPLRYRISQIDRPDYGKSYNYYKGSSSYRRTYSDPGADGFDVLSAGNQKLNRDRRDVGGNAKTDVPKGIVSSKAQVTPPDQTEVDNSTAAQQEPIEPDDPDKYQKRLEKARARLNVKPVIDKSVRPYKDEIGRRKMLKQMTEVLDVMKDQEQFMDTTIQKAKDEGTRTAEEIAEAEEAMAELRRGKIEMQTKIKIVIDDDFDDKD